MILAFFASVGTWFGGVGGWLKANPLIAKILIGLAILFALWFGKERWKANIEKGVRRQERERYERIQQEQIESQRQEAASRVEAFNEAVRDIERLPEHELRKQTETDPNNRGRVHRD